jgi:hypothetical protein
MTLIKSLLLGSAAGIVAIASAQAADLPTKKGAPAAEYVRVCKITVNGAPVVGFTLPSSDTCLKIGGYVSAQLAFANNAGNSQDSIGMFARGNLSFDAVSNTAMGPLLGHIDLNAQWGSDFDYFAYAAGGTYVDNIYVQWAGITAGIHGSYFDFLAGGPTWDDFISPDHTGSGTLLWAYTATLGGGFSATLSAEAPRNAPGIGNYTAGPAAGLVGIKTPDWVLQLAVSQAWGKAQLSFLAHEAYQTNAFGVYSNAWNVSPANTWGWGVNGGVKFNLPGMAGSDIALQGTWTKDAVNYSGLTSWGGYYLSGVAPLPAIDIWNGSDNTAWSVAGFVDLAVGPTFTITPEASYGSMSYNGGPSETVFVGGGTLAWKPVTNLQFNLDLLYASGNVSNDFPFNGNFSGFAGKLRMERDF